MDIVIYNTKDMIHTPPLLNDSSLTFLTTARIYTKLHALLFASFVRPFAGNI